MTQNIYSLCLPCFSGKNEQMHPKYQGVLPLKAAEMSSESSLRHQKELQPEMQSLALVVMQWEMQESLGWRDGVVGVVVCVRSALRCQGNKAVSLFYRETDTEDSCVKSSGPQIVR